MRALILDDEAAIGRVICRVAQSAGFIAESATEPAAFQAYYRLARPDVVLLDLQLGKEDGISQLRFLAEQHHQQAVVLVSGFDRRVLAAAERLGRDLGLDVVTSLVKPFRAEELAALFDRLAAQLSPLTAGQLFDAIANDELALDYQPIVEPAQRKVIQLEALVRWRHPARGILGPDRFIPLAESDTATIDRLTEWVVTTAARDCLRMQAHGPGTRMAVNVSVRNLDKLDFPDRVEAIVDRERVPPSLFSLELTESAAAQHPIKNVDVLSRLRLKGIDLALDDFGIGYSSLKVLHTLPFSTIKIDRSFVADLADSRDSQAIVKAMVDLARNMEIDCIAEGVESQESAKLLEDFGVRKLQGYLFSKPRPIEELTRWQHHWQAA